MTVTRQEILTLARSGLNRLNASTSQGKTYIAKLRRLDTAGDIADKPQIWDLLYSSFVPPAGANEFETARIEKALLITYQLYALHLRKNASLSSDGGEFASVGKLLLNATQTSGVAANRERQVSALLGADDVDEVARKLRRFIDLAPSSRLDYPSIAWDFYQLQSEYDFRKVLFRWGKDFYKSGASQIESIAASSQKAV